MHQWKDVVVAEGVKEQVLLLVDDEPNILSALTRLLRRDGYRILTANSGEAGLDMLAQHPEVAVILSDQRMPGMTGVEFLSRAKAAYPETVRMVLSGYTELESVTDAINRGAIYRFLTKPWDDDLLRANLAEAFRHYGMVHENQRLNTALAQANTELEDANRKLEHYLEVQSGQIERNLDVLRLSQELLENLPFAVLGVAEDGMIALANQTARDWMPGDCQLLGSSLTSILPTSVLPCSECQPARGGSGDWKPACLQNGMPVRYWCHSIGQHCRSRGCLLVMVPDTAADGDPGRSAT